MMARWIRFRKDSGPQWPIDFDEACARLASAQRVCAPRQASPILLWGEGDGEYPFALIVPLRLAPGRQQRWRAWGLAPAVAAYRQFGVPAYFDDALDGGDIWLHGRRISRSVAAVLGECVVLAASFLMQFPGKCVATPSRELEQAFRLRLEAQHGWQFEHSWPTEAETASVAVA